MLMKPFKTIINKNVNIDKGTIAMQDDQYKENNHQKKGGLTVHTVFSKLYNYVKINHSVINDSYKCDNRLKETSVAEEKP